MCNWIKNIHWVLLLDVDYLVWHYFSHPNCLVVLMLCKHGRWLIFLKLNPANGKHKTLLCPVSGLRSGIMTFTEWAQTRRGRHWESGAVTAHLGTAPVHARAGERDVNHSRKFWDHCGFVPFPLPLAVCCVFTGSTVWHPDCKQSTKTEEKLRVRK